VVTKPPNKITTRIKTG